MSPHWHGVGSDAVRVPGPVGDCCETGRLTKADREAMTAGWPDFWQVHAAVERIVAAREAAAEQRGRDAVLADVEAIDAAHLARQRDWSRATFGPGTRLLGVLDHIRKELDEIEAAPHDVEEWVDVIILAFDGAWRAGWEPEQIIAAIKAKQAKNEARTWPDWRTASPDRAIEHVRPTDHDDRSNR